MRALISSIIPEITAWYEADPVLAVSVLVGGVLVIVAIVAYSLAACREKRKIERADRAFYHMEEVARLEEKREEEKRERLERERQEREERERLEREAQEAQKIIQNTGENGETKKKAPVKKSVAKKTPNAQKKTTARKPAKSSDKRTDEE